MSHERYASLRPIDLRVILFNARGLARKTRLPWWSFASTLFGVGSNSGIQLCKRAGVGPDEEVRKGIF